MEKDVPLGKFYLGSLSNWTLASTSDKEYMVELKVGCEDFDIPKKWDFRKGWYFVKDGVWYYHRKFGIFSLKTRFNPKENTFHYFPRILGKMAFVYNGFYPIGVEVSNILMYQFLKKGFVVLKASAFYYKSKVFLLIAPSYNGKTTIVKEVISSAKNGKYISEEVLFLSEDRLIGLPPSNVSWRDSNRDFILDTDEMFLDVGKPDYVLFYTVGSSDSLQYNFCLPEYPILESYFYFSESMVSAIMYYEDNIKSANLVKITDRVLSESKLYKITTNGYNSERFFNYLDEIIKQ